MPYFQNASPWFIFPAFSSEQDGTGSAPQTLAISKPSSNALGCPNLRLFTGSPAAAQESSSLKEDAGLCRLLTWWGRAPEGRVRTNTLARPKAFSLNSPVQDILQIGSRESRQSLKEFPRRSRGLVQACTLSIRRMRSGAPASPRPW